MGFPFPCRSLERDGKAHVKARARGFSCARVVDIRSAGKTLKQPAAAVFQRTEFLVFGFVSRSAAFRSQFLGARVASVKDRSLDFVTVFYEWPGDHFCVFVVPKLLTCHGGFDGGVHLTSRWWKSLGGKVLY